MEGAELVGSRGCYAKTLSPTQKFSRAAVLSMDLSEGFSGPPKMVAHSSGMSYCPNWRSQVSRDRVRV